VQADPIRAPARVQDLILFHRVRNYRAGDLERRYAQLGIEEDFWETYVVPVANFRFYAELNDFLAPERRFTEFAYAFLDVTTVKDRIESFGVPHTEVDLILVNGQSVDFAYRVQDGDRISVYPVFEPPHGQRLAGWVAKDLLIFRTPA
jgi:hypothetical protein